MTRAETRRLIRGIFALWFFSVVITAVIVRAAVTGEKIL
jgi:hypothetical protein